jgi:hypothetical protein
MTTACTTHISDLQSRPGFALITGGWDQSGRCHSLTQSAVWVMYHVTCSNRSEREESYDIIVASIKYSGDMFVPYKEVGDTFVPYMEVSITLASNNEIIGRSYPPIINGNHGREPRELAALGF